MQLPVTLGIAFTVQTVGDVAVGTHYFANGFLSLETPKLFLNQSWSGLKFKHI